MSLDGRDVRTQADRAQQNLTQLERKTAALGHQQGRLKQVPHNVSGSQVDGHVSSAQAVRSSGSTTNGMAMKPRAYTSDQLSWHSPQSQAGCLFCGRAAAGG